MIKDILQVEPGTIVIPFSAESKQGREEIWTIADNLLLNFRKGTFEAEKMPKQYVTERSTLKT